MEEYRNLTVFHAHKDPFGYFRESEIKRGPLGSLKQTPPPPKARGWGGREKEKQREGERERKGLLEQSINKYDLFCISPWTERWTQE